jgi:ribosome biogenesis GTPase
MLTFDPESLLRIGLTPILRERARALAATLQERACALPDPAGAADLPRALGRLTAVHRETVQWHDGARERLARPLPRLVRELHEDGSALVVGDWVLLAADAHGGVDADDGWWLHARVPPANHVVRRDANGARHAVVSNVDTVLVVMGLDDDFNLRRVERYLALAQASGAEAVLVLTKADVAARERPRLVARLAAIDARFGDALERIAIDATDPATAARFAERMPGRLAPGQTLVLLGSSGAGKSTLTNTLLGQAVQDTGPVRAHDSRGMHTTTARTLHRMPGGACIVDTPGVRTLRADLDEVSLAASFGDVERLAMRCRFRDCAHAGEPGCAVRESVEPDRLRNFQKMLRETRRDAQTWIERRQQVAAWKSRGKAARERMRHKRGE